MWILFLSFLRKNWKILTVITLVLGVLAYTYEAGKRHAVVAVERATAKELEKRYDNAEKEKDKLQRTDTRINNSRRVYPGGSSTEADKRDSCLLSNDPYTTECVE